MIGMIIAGLIVIGLSITTIVSRINERREDIEREHEERKRAKLAAKVARAAEEGAGGDATSGDETVAIGAEAQKTMAIEDNKGKKPGLKTRIMGFKDQKDKDKEDFNYDPSQSQTRQIGGPDKQGVSPRAQKVPKGSEVNGTKRAQNAPTPMKGFVLPSMDILKAPTEGSEVKQSEDLLKAKAEKLRETLEEFGINANVVG